MIRHKARPLYSALAISVAVVAAGVVGLDSASGVVPPSIAANPTTITAGASTTVTWDKIVSPTTKDWIGLYASSGAADTAFLAFRYTDSTTANGNEPFTIPAGTPPASGYRFRIFSNDTFNRLGQGGAFIVT